MKWLVKGHIGDRVMAYLDSYPRGMVTSMCVNHGAPSAPGWQGVFQKLAYDFQFWRQLRLHNFYPWAKSSFLIKIVQNTWFQDTGRNNISVIFPYVSSDLW